VNISNIQSALLQIINIIRAPPNRQQIQAMMFARELILYRYNIWAVIESTFFETRVIHSKPLVKHNINVIGMRRSGNHYVSGLIIRSFGDGKVNWFNNVTSVHLSDHMKEFYHITRNDKRTGNISIAKKLRGDNPFISPSETDCVLQGYYDYSLEMLGERINSENGYTNVLVLRDLFNMCASRFICTSKFTRVDLTGVDGHIKEEWKSYAREFLGETSFLGKIVCVNYNTLVNLNPDDENDVRMKDFKELLRGGSMCDNNVMKFMGGSSFTKTTEPDYNKRYLQLSFPYLHILSQWWRDDDELRRLHHAIFGFTPKLNIDTGYDYFPFLRTSDPNLRVLPGFPIKMMVEADKMDKCAAFNSDGEYKASFTPKSQMFRTNTLAYDISRGTYVKNKVEQYRRFHSQYGQDRYCFNMFLRERKTGIYVDVGASDGVTISNTLAFENRGFEGLCIEPRDDAFTELRRNRKCYCEKVGISDVPKENVEFLNIKGYGKSLSGIVSEYDPRHLQRIKDESTHPKHESAETIYIQTVTLQSLLDKYGWDTVDFLSVDTEGNEMKVLKSIDWKRTRVNVITVENNYRENNIRRFLINKGFKLCTQLGADEVYVHNNFTV